MMFDEKRWGRCWLFVPLVLLASCNPCWGQIDISAQKTQVVSGLEQPRIIGGVVLAEGGTPRIAPAAVIEVKFTKPYKFFDIEAENVQTFELGTLTKIDDTHWLLVGAGKYRVSGMALDPDIAKDREFVELGVTPVPPPVPPEPGPGPTPDPTPTPDGDAPIPEPGFRVLIVYESGDLPKIPKWVADSDFVGYLNTHCVKSSGGQSEYRIVDPQAVVSPQLPIWSKALARPRTTLPWLIVSNGKTGFEGPLPTTKAETLAILTKYAEAK